MIQAQFKKDFEGWRAEARRFLLQRMPPEKIHWDEENPLLILEAPEPEIAGVISGAQHTVPQEFLNLAEAVACARDEDRWALLYRILFRLSFENHNLLKISVDPDINRAALIQKSVRRDIHKMHAFVRFKQTMAEGEELYVAWHKPEHLILRAAVPFFIRRFGDRRWSIFTPDESAYWDKENISFGPGIEQTEFNIQDDWDEVWKTYYKSIFNPARVKIKAMKMEMAPKYWAALPEAAVINELIREAPHRLQGMAANKNQGAEVPPNLSLPELKEASQGCRGCPLADVATQTVFGEGSANSEIMIVGEQPGDQEDLQGRPFVGPAGQLLNELLRASGLNRPDLYITNAVKHFKFQREGKLRIHQKPSGGEMHACKPWLDAEIERVKPKIIVALGATAATAILGRLPKISAERGKVLVNTERSFSVIVSWHPSAILRATGDNARKMQSELEDDLRLAAAYPLLSKKP